jgi:hypothetical protein
MRHVSRNGEAESKISSATFAEWWEPVTEVGVMH